MARIPQRNDLVISPPGDPPVLELRRSHASGRESSERSGIGRPGGLVSGSPKGRGRENRGRGRGRGSNGIGRGRGSSGRGRGRVSHGRGRGVPDALGRIQGLAGEVFRG